VKGEGTAASVAHERRGCFEKKGGVLVLNNLRRRGSEEEPWRRKKEKTGALPPDQKKKKRDHFSFQRKLIPLWGKEQRIERKKKGKVSKNDKTNSLGNARGNQQGGLPGKKRRREQRVVPEASERRGESHSFALKGTLS